MTDLDQLSLTDLSDPRTQLVIDLLTKRVYTAGAVAAALSAAGLAPGLYELTPASQAWNAAVPDAARAGRLGALITCATGRAPGLLNELETRLTALTQSTVPPPRQSASNGFGEEVDRILSEAPPSRSPIVIAVEDELDELSEAELPRTERHLTLRLTADQLDVAARLAEQAFSSATNVENLIEAGARIWQTLTAAEPRLIDLFKRLAGVGLAQPVAWCARSDVLGRFEPALLLAHTGDGKVDGFISVTKGSHYFTPMGGDRRSMKQRSTDVPHATIVDLRGTPPDRLLARLSFGTSAEVIVAVDPLKTSAVLPALTDLVGVGTVSPTRAAVVFGDQRPQIQLTEELLSRIPFVSFADESLAESELLDAVQDVVRVHGPTRAMPTILAAFRAAWIRRAADRQDTPQCSLGIMWSNWGWVGLPLFAQEYGEVMPAEYPHLMDLRSVEGDWYFPRREGIPSEYQANVLAQTDLPPEERFHLYLTGAGGTGKSCFLRDVFHQVDYRSTSIAVWYRIDSPSSRWENVEERIREETLLAVTKKFGFETGRQLSAIKGRLAGFLREGAAKLRLSSPDFDEIVVFIDQLERTFEAGVGPDDSRLGTISRALMALLRDIRADQSVRILIASRKQYLPDFLGSSRTANSVRLEFNVLQAVADGDEQVEFVRRVLDWCIDQHFVSPELTITPSAAKQLAESVHGEPLSMNLALIALLSADHEVSITSEGLRRRDPSKRLFAPDMQAAARNDIDWFFLLATAHARAEIVGIEEILWRLRMVHSGLTRQVDDLGPKGILERLWLFGYLGRTIHARPQNGLSGRLIEFFHANFRDYLLRDVMAHGSADLDLQERRGGTPPAWGALDRLAVYAHDWEQTRQLLPAEDIRALMAHRSVLIEKLRDVASANEEPQPLRLLFQRDPEGARRALSQAAMECLVFSALVHDDSGRQVFGELFPEIEKRSELCAKWLRDCSPSTRPSVIKYFVELQSDSARQLLIGLVLDSSSSLREQVSQSLATILAEPLYAARYRDEVIAALLSNVLPMVKGDASKLPREVASLVVLACRAERIVLTQVLGNCIERFLGSDDAAIVGLADKLASETLVDHLLQETAAYGGFGLIGMTERKRSAGESVLGLVIGDRLKAAFGDGRLASWSQELRDRIGVPLPPLVLTRSETTADPQWGAISENQVELTALAGRIGGTAFFPDRKAVLKSQWEQFGQAAPASAPQRFVPGLEEDLVWLTPDELGPLNDRLVARGFDEIMVDWLEAHCRRSFIDVWDDELFRQMLDEIPEATIATVFQLGCSTAQLRHVVASLVIEGVPLVPLRRLFDELIDVLPSVQAAETPISVQRSDRLLMKLRERLRADICRAVTDESGRVTAILLDGDLELALANSLTDPSRGPRPDEAHALVAALCRQADRIRGDPATPTPVVITLPVLRLTLAMLLRDADLHLPVLSITEAEQHLSPVFGGIVDVPEILRAAS